ncbi:MAG: nitroreductase [Clostridiales bacterium GWC2_40_7]|nr:MAG: nitroreductase [Clostridiales bacterium GWC2_40_7]
MSFLELARRRFSVRKYKQDMVEDEKMRLILEAGRVAPSAKNMQPQRLIVVQKKEYLERIGKTANIHGAPAAIIICGSTNNAWVRPYDSRSLVDVDVSIVTDHMMLMATDLGLGSLWICNFDPEIIRKEFDLPENIRPVNILALGYSDCPPASPDRHNEKRKPLEETVLRLC